MILIIPIGCTVNKSNEIAFVDDNFRKAVLKSLGRSEKDTITADDILNTIFLFIQADFAIDSYEDLEKFTNLSHLSLINFTQYQLESILDNCQTSLTALSIKGNENYELSSDILFKTERLSIQTSKNINVNFLEPTDYLDLGNDVSLSASSIRNINNLKYLNNILYLNLTTKNGFDDVLDCEFLLNSPNISELAIVNGKIKNNSIIGKMENLDVLILHDTIMPEEDIDWASQFIDIEYLIIMENHKSLIDNIFEK